MAKAIDTNTTNSTSQRDIETTSKFVLLCIFALLVLYAYSSINRPQENEKRIIVIDSDNLEANSPKTRHSFLRNA